jgi:hypothetical protein
MRGLTYGSFQGLGGLLEEEAVVGVEVGSSGVDGVRVVTEKTDGSVAVTTEQSSNRTGVVVVINA